MRYDSAVSGYRSVSVGVPQGSIPGPLLFFVYVNDVPIVAKRLITVVYVNDTSFFNCFGPGLYKPNKCVYNELKDLSTLKRTC